MQWSRFHIAALTLIQLVVICYSHGDLYLVAEMFASREIDCACCRACLCDDGPQAPGDCQVRTAGCTHENVQTLMSFIKNGGPLPGLPGISINATDPLPIPSTATLPVPGFGLGVFHPPRG